MHKTEKKDPDLYVDMHFHTTKSDWIKSYNEREEQIYSQWKNSNWLLMAIVTDHDIAQDRLSGNWYSTCSWVEVSTIEENTWFSAHILFYANQFTHKVDETLKKVREVKIENVMRNLETLIHCNQWFEVSISDCLEFFSLGGYNTGNLNNFQLARYVISKTENRTIASRLTWVDIQDDLKWYVNFYSNFLKRNGQFHKYGFNDDNCNVWISPEELSVLANEEWWILSFAHPQITCRRWMDQFEEVFDRYNTQYWIKAIEAPEVLSATTDRIDCIRAKIATIDNWLLTFWSDSHWHPDFDHAAIFNINWYIPINEKREHAERFKKSMCMNTPLSKIQ